MTERASAHFDEEAATRWSMGDATEAERTHLAGCAECQAQVVGELRHDRLAIISIAFAEDGDLFHSADGANLDGELSDDGMPPDQVLDLRRVEVDAAHREHAVYDVTTFFGWVSTTKEVEAALHAK